MVSNKIIAAAIVIVVVVAAAGAFILLSGGEEDDGLGEITGRLQVYGNANNDDFIDDSDLLAFDTLMENGWDSEQYPYADANRDGELTAADREIIQKIINKDDVEIYYIDGKQNIKTMGYPVDQVGLAGTMTYPVLEALDAVDRVAGRCDSSSMDPVLCSEIINLPSLGPKPYELLVEKLSDYPRIDVIITQYSSSYDEVEEVATNAGKDCIRLDADTTEGALHGYLLMGFVTDTSERASEIAQFYDSTISDIQSKLAGISESDRVKTLTNYSYFLCGKNYYLTLNTVNGGGVNLTTFESNTQSIRDNQESLLNYSDVKVQFCYGSNGWGTMTDQEKADEWWYYAQYFTYSSAYPDNYYHINKDMPDVCRSAFVASILYPDIFGDDYGYTVLQNWVDSFYDFMGDYDVHSDGVWVITYDEVKDLIPSS